ncbi:hypothetical protein Ahy_B05g073946 [Arachis hypogaea]|uniref:Uncharacterized protein n=1 Tax=Arachis hypogaea TaxID=3818 RepID=A0A444YXL0_ARAHY|nr:hypothetical protein Ahy_B05g073946 [Arachis hypogaea]
MWLMSRKGGSGFSSSSTAEQVTHGIDATGPTTIVTDNDLKCAFWLLLGILIQGQPVVLVLKLLVFLLCMACM